MRNPAAPAGFPSVVGKSALWTFPRSGFFHSSLTHKFCYRALCCLLVDLIWRNLLYIPVERETLFRVSLASPVQKQRSGFPENRRQCEALRSPVLLVRRRWQLTSGDGMQNVREKFVLDRDFPLIEGYPFSGMGRRDQEQRLGSPPRAGPERSRTDGVPLVSSESRKSSTKAGPASV